MYLITFHFPKIVLKKGTKQKFTIQNDVTNVRYVAIHLFCHHLLSPYSAPGIIPEPEYTDSTPFIKTLIAKWTHYNHKHNSKPVYEVHQNMEGNGQSGRMKEGVEWACINKEVPLQGSILGLERWEREVYQLDKGKRNTRQRDRLRWQLPAHLVQVKCKSARPPGLESQAG